MVAVLSGLIDRFTHDDTVKIEEMELEELREERSEIKADMELKRDKHEGLAEKRRKKFERLRGTSDDLLQEELAEEIASIEDEMAIYHNEHAQLMDALRVLDGLIAVKRKQQLMEDKGIVQDLEDMDREELVDMIKREDVQEMIREEKWDDLEDLFRGDLRADFSGNKRVRDIIDSAEEHDDKSVDEALRIRDQQRGHDIH
jgi:arsenate reductase-like glutaredoxin family protein